MGKVSGDGILNSDRNSRRARLRRGSVRGGFGRGSVIGTLDEMRDLMELVAVTGIRPENGLELPMKRAESA
jgi:hypothetical protein